MGDHIREPTGDICIDRSRGRLITVAVLAILNTSRLQENARKQHLSAAAIGVAHTLKIYLGIIELLKKHPPDQRANSRILLNMTKPAREALAQILSNSVDDTALYRMGVILQTASGKRTVGLSTFEMRMGRKAWRWIDTPMFPLRSEFS